MGTDIQVGTLLTARNKEKYCKITLRCIIKRILLKPVVNPRLSPALKNKDERIASLV